MFNRIKTDLPNVPDEVISTWLVPLAAVEGWPPSFVGEWPRLLLQRPLVFYQGLVWQRTAVALNPYNLTPKAHDAVMGLIECNVYGIANVYSQQITNTRKRFGGLCAYLRAHGELPVPPVLLREGFAYAILDGNHRIAAYTHVHANTAGFAGPVCWVGGPPQVKSGAV